MRTHRPVIFSIDDDLLDRLDRFAPACGRSAVIRRALTEYLDRQLRAECGQAVR